MSADCNKNKMAILTGRLRMIAVAAIVAAVAFVGGAERPASADATTYSASKRQFKVGVLLLESTIDHTDKTQEAKGPENPDPYVFLVADARADVKPQGWEFVNPLAPGTITPDVRARWLARDRNNPYIIGQHVNKDMAAYWEVSLRQASVTDLLQYDLLFITNHRTTRFTPTEREKLRKVVDAGGIVWIENCGGMTIIKDSPFFLEQLSFRDGAPIGAPLIYQPDHPILNAPYRLSFDEINKLGDKQYTSFMVSLSDNKSQPDANTLVNIVGNSAATDGNNVGLPYIAAGSYGGGRVIATASDCGCDINDYIGGTNIGSGGNSGAYSGKNYTAAHTEDLKFLYNMVAWGSSSTDFRRNGRRLASSFDSVGAPLVSTFDFRNDLTKNLRPDDIVNSRVSGVIAKGAYFVTGVNPVDNTITVRGYDLNPLRDLDGDGNADDGLPDLTLGLPYDEIWRWTGPKVTGQASPPVFATILADNDKTTADRAYRDDRLFVTMPDGALVILTAFNRSGGSFLAAPVVKAVVAGTGGPYGGAREVAPAPVVFENRVYQIEPNGLLRCLDARDGSLLWQTFKKAPNYTIFTTGSPAFGFSRQIAENGALSRNSGGNTNDLMLYSPSRVRDQGNPSFVARILTYWLGTRNEVLRFGNDPENSNGVVKTRVAGGISGGPFEGEYLVALPGINTAAPDAFIQPRVRIFSMTPKKNPSDPNEPPITAQDNYNAGFLSPAYALKDPKNPISEDGRVTLVRTDNTYPDLNGAADIMVAVDYDVMYISGKTGNVPPNYAANPTQIGARPNTLLSIPSADFAGSTQNYAGQTFSTPAFGADDLLMFGTRQRFPTGNLNPVFPTIFALNEQEGDYLTPTNSRMAWRFPIFNAFGAQNSLTYTRTVDNQTVTDIKPLVNYLTFDANWPKSDAATKMLTPEPLTNVNLIGTPVVTNTGITYFLASANSASNGNRTLSVLMAFRTNPEIILTLKRPFDTNAGVTVEQFDLLSDQGNSTGGSIIRASSNQANNAQFTLDGDRGRIVIKNFRGSNGGFSASQSFVVKYYTRDGRNEQIDVVAPVPQGAGDSYGQTVDATGRVSSNQGGFTPLLFYYVLPVLPDSQPTLIGDYVYFNGRLSTQQTVVAALDARPFEGDPSVRLGFSEPAPNVTGRTDGKTNLINHLRLQIVGTLVSNNIVVAEGAPVGGEGSLVINSHPLGNQAQNLGTGSFAFNNGVTTIADSRRIIEADASAAAVWTLESTVSASIAGGALPIYNGVGGITNPPGLGVQNLARQSLARPTSLQRIGASDYLLADTGNNRVARVDRSGAVLWSLNRFSDPFQIASSGDPLNLNEPTDLTYYIAPTLNGGNVAGYEVHYLIADAGNYRIIEVADYYDANGKPVSDPLGLSSPGDHVLVWSSRIASDQGKRLRFQSIQRFLGRGPEDSDFAAYFGYPYITAVVSNARLGAEGPAADTAGGSLINIRYAPFNTTLTFRDASGAAKPARLWAPPASGASARTSEPPSDGTILASLTEFNIVNGTVERLKQINNPTFFQQINLPAVAGNPAKTLYLLCDLDGAYVLELRQRKDAAGKVKTVLDALWQFTRGDYDYLNGRAIPARLTFPGYAPGTGIPTPLAGQMPKFQPVSLQLLANGNYLITNGWSGRSSLFENGQFNGEVFEVKPAGNPVLSPLPFTATVNGGAFASFSVPRLEGGETSGGVTVGLNRQVMGDGNGNTGLLEQPLFAIRP